MKRSFILSAILICLFTNTAFAQTSIKAEIDKTSLTTDEVLTYKLIISSLEKEIPAPELPKFSGFKVVSSAQSSSVTLIGGSMKSIVVYAFVLMPREEGKFKFEPASIKINKEIFSTGAFELEVKKGNAKPSAAPESKPVIPEKSPSQETDENPQVTI
jgi:hypothetical protein